jgi:hypothetical protein
MAQREKLEENIPWNKRRISTSPRKLQAYK